MSDPSTEAIDREDVDAATQPRPSGREGAPVAGCLIACVVILLPALLYFGVFAAILINELVFVGSWVTENVPEPGIEVLRTIYAPLIWLMNQFTW